MNRRTVAAVAVGLVAVTALSAVLLRGGLGAAPRPNVLLVVWDTARADRMSLYGYAKPTTPRLAAFAAEGAVYDRATAPGMWTLNSHAAMFTGLYETSHGATPSHRWLDAHYTTLAESARAGGYDTFFWSANLVASPMTNLTQGFDTVHTAFPREGDRAGRYTKAAKQATRKKLIPNDASTEISPAFAGSTADEWAKAVFKDSAPVGHQALTDWLDERAGADAPFFAYLNLMEAHTPRVPSVAARRRVADDATIRTALTTDSSLFAANEFIIGQRDYSEGELGAIGATYDAALVDLDDATGDLLDDLRARGVLDDTVVIVVADHGEALGEHRRLEHRWSVFDQLLHVPLVVWYPPRVPAGRVPDRVTTLDVYATVLDLMGIDREKGTSGSSLVGRAAFDPFVFAQMLDPFASQLRTVAKAYPEADLREWARTYCVAYQGDDKLVYASDGAHALYDVAADPGEATDRSASAPEVRAKLEQALTAFESELSVYDPSLRAAEDEAGADSSAEERARLAALGYVVDDEQPDVHHNFCGPFASTGK